MPVTISKRLLDIIDALPLKEGMRVLEIGCGPGSAAREVNKRIGKSGYILAIDRSAKAIQQAIANSQAEIALGNLDFQQVAIEQFSLPSGQPLFDLVFAVRVGALDGRHPEAGKLAIQQIRKILKRDGSLFIDGTEYDLS
jgi:SAM-dependent methyltransferase